MGDHWVLCVDCLSKPEPLQSSQGPEALGSFSEGSCSHATEKLSYSVDVPVVEELDGANNEGKPLLQMFECRICQEEDSLGNMETPCACTGSLKYAQRKCVQRWCNEKGDTNCEICHQPYQPGYTAPPPAPTSEDTIIDIGGGWRIHRAPMDLQDPQLLAMAAAERHLLEAEYDECADPNASGAAFCRSAALILMGLLLLWHALTIGNDDDDDASTFFSVSEIFLVRAAGFLLPCYIMAWAISTLQRRRQAQEAAAAALAATEVAFIIHAAQHQEVHFTVNPGPTDVTPGSILALP